MVKALFLLFLPKNGANGDDDDGDEAPSPLLPQKTKSRGPC